jgi:hypothetical protein
MQNGHWQSSLNQESLFYYFLEENSANNFEFDPWFYFGIYCKVANSSLSQLVASFHIFRRLMKGKLDTYVL